MIDGHADRARVLSSAVAGDAPSCALAATACGAVRPAEISAGCSATAGLPLPAGDLHGQRIDLRNIGVERSGDAA